MTRIPGSRMADDVATRFEVPIQMEDINQQTTSDSGDTVAASNSNLSLAQLFEILSNQDDFPEYAVERISLESVFLKVVGEHNVLEENTTLQPKSRGHTKWGCC
jgi:hypothetical protein